jgi:hypothetical protein
MRTELPARKPVFNAHKFGLYQQVYVAKKEYQDVGEFQCEVCIGKGHVELHTKDRIGQITLRKAECWYCGGEGKRSERDYCWKVIGPGRISNYSANIFEDGKGTLYHYLTYRVVFPEFYGRENGDLLTEHPRDFLIFATEEEAIADCDRRNVLLFAGQPDEPETDEPKTDEPKGENHGT